MRIITEYANAFVALFLFRRYTCFPRLLEIGYSLVAWGCLLIILWAVTSCHPYPYKSIKPDKTKHATFR